MSIKPCIPLYNVNRDLFTNIALVRLKTPFPFNMLS